jgi:hypothetical protein
VSASVSVVQGAVRPDGRGRGRRRRGEAARRRREGSRRPLLSVQALLQSLSVHAAPSVGGRLPAPHAPGPRRPRPPRRRDASGPHARQRRPGRPPGEPCRPALELDERAERASRVHAGGGGHPSQAKPAEVPPPHLLVLVQVTARGLAADGAGAFGVPRRQAAEEGGAVPHVQRRVLRAGDRAGGGARPREEPRRRARAAAAVLRHALPRRRRGGRSEGPHSRQRQEPGRGGARGLRDRRPRPHVQLHAEAGVPVARRLGGREARGREHAGPLRVPRGSRRRARSTPASPDRSAP